uniref:Uncharacterized protein n=1 Tax=Romanomermis culicivorax TaxID=13658 RepID=A0A915L2Z1_ROMCU
MNQNILLGYLTIHNVDKNNIENQLIVILNVPFYFHSESDRFTLKPTPLSFTKETKVIILQPGDVAEFMSIKLSKTVDDFLTVLKSNETHLILTNMMNPNIKYDENNLFTIYLVDYYRSEANAHLFNSLQMEFNDGSTFNRNNSRMSIAYDVLQTLV